MIHSHMQISSYVTQAPCWIRFYNHARFSVILFSKYLECLGFSAPLGKEHRTHRISSVQTSCTYILRAGILRIIQYTI